MTSASAPSLARALWQYGEPIHAIAYFAPETRRATDELGLKGGWMSYFGCRAAPLGAASAATVAAVFYNFHPKMVRRAIPDAWSFASPEALLEARITAVDAVLRQILGDDAVRSPAFERAASLASAAVSNCEMAGRSMGAANQAVPSPEEPHLRLWQALTTIREYRGDGHVAALVSAGISPSQALVLQAASGRSPEESLRSHRGWSDEEWEVATTALVARGWVDVQGRITQTGTEGRDEVERVTDRLASPIVTELGSEQTEELVSLLQPITEAIMSAGAVPTHNNMGVPWPPREETVTGSQQTP